jgi:predicted nuclease of restriction endonuclease-like (RecB) superfamily
LKILGILHFASSSAEWNVRPSTIKGTAEAVRDAESTTGNPDGSVGLTDLRQQGETWGRAVVENLAKDLRAEFPGIGGFSAANLWRIKQFYEAYAKDEKLAPLVREISWTKNLVILERCKDSAERQFYLERTKQFGWTKNVLIHQIENKKTVLNQTNFDVALPEHIRNQARLAVKGEYTFDFLELADEHSERQLVNMGRPTPVRSVAGYAVSR